MTQRMTTYFAIFSLLCTPLLKAQEAQTVSPSIQMTDTPSTGNFSGEKESPPSTNLPDNSSLQTPGIEQQTPTPPSTEDQDSDLEEESPGTPVGQGNEQGAKTAKRRQWQNIVIAVVAVAVAITALVLVASNDGHH